jgi:hypothetical protein
MSDVTNQSVSAVSLEEMYTPEYIEKRRRALEATDMAVGFKGIDDLDPKLPAGHAYAIRKSTWLTTNSKLRPGKSSMDIKPQDVIDVLNNAGIKNWVLMGLHGYVGYMPDPRATQDVDVMVPYTQRKRAKKAIAERWPSLVVHELSQVVRFLDPLDVDRDGKPKAAVDLMAPWSPFQEVILKDYVIVDEETKHRLPTLEAALASKYAAMVSPYRDRDKKEQDAVDFRRLVRANHDRIRKADLRRLADMILEKGGDEVMSFVEIALSDRPFPI